MKIKRVLTALIGFPLVAALLILGNNYMVDIAFSITAILAIREYFHVFNKEAKPVRWIGYLSCIFIAFIHIIPREYVLRIIGMSIPSILTILFIQVIFSKMKVNVKDIAITLLGICYTAGFILYIPLLHGASNGKILIWYILFAAWGTDTFAYFTGMKYGKHKFTQVSPNKSLEGCVGGLVGAVVISLIYTIIINQYTDINISYLGISIIAIILSIFGQIGDLSASSIKRYLKIKDFSDLIPGHGGMLDRIDSIIFIAPFAYFLLMLI